VQVPRIPSGSVSVWAQYSVLSDERERLQAAMKKAGIPTAVYYPKPLHLQGAFSTLGYKAGDFPVSETASEKIFSLPMHPYLKDEEIARVVDVIVSSVSSGAKAAAN